MEKQNKSKVDLTDLVNSLAQETGLKAGRKNIHFRYRMEHVRTPHVLTDKQKLRVILEELLENAITFTPEGGDVILSVSEMLRSDGGAMYEFYVQDDGIGMSEEEQKRVFCSAVPADENPRGLMIVRTLTEELDGKLTYESADGLGTIVRILIRFPEDTEFVQEPRQDFSRDIYHFEGTRILLVEDHPLNLDIAKNLLERTGVDVETAVNAEDAVKLFRERGDEFDMILMDIRMPVMDGVAATKEIRMSGCGKAETIPIIALTASAYEGDIRRSSAAGMNGSILKPIDPGKLYGVMRHYLYRPA